VPGWDCHGLPIEVAVEKKVGKVGVKVDAAEFRKLCREYASKQIDLQREDFKRLGVLGEWENPYRTMDFKYEADIIRALAKIVANGHVLRGFKPVHWCFDCGSALAEAEIEYQDKTLAGRRRGLRCDRSGRVAAKFDVQAGADDIVAVPIWTTTPWTLPASIAVTLGGRTRLRADRRAAARSASACCSSLPKRCWKKSANATMWRMPAVLGRVKGAALASLPPLQGEGRGGEMEVPDGRRENPGPSPQPLSRGEEGSTMLRHPFYDRENPDYPRRTRFRRGRHRAPCHTAPGHGVEDFAGRTKIWTCGQVHAGRTEPARAKRRLPARHADRRRPVHLESERGDHRPCCASAPSCSLRKRSRTATRTAGATARRSFFRATPQMVHRHGDGRACAPARSRRSTTT
jgi:isoleucyl-tRNA synthetase